MPVDPQLAQLIASAPPLAYEGETPQQARVRFREMAANPKLADLVRPVGSLTDTEVPGATGPLPARVYRPAGEGAHATVLYLHGGGWVLGGIDTHDGFCRELCEQAGAVVVSVEYRLAPEHPFPAGLEDCVAAARWVAEHLSDLGGDPARFAVSGDSAGGGLAAVVAQELSVAPAAVPLAAQLLIYPVTDMSREYPSYKEFGTGFYLDRRVLRLIADAYFPDHSVLDDPRMSPMLFEKLELLPRTVVVGVECDPIRDQGEAYVDALTEAGVDARELRLDGLVHGFIHFGPYVPACQQGIDRTCAAFREALAAA